MPEKMTGGGHGGPSLPPPWLVYTVAVVILVVWVSSFIIRVIWPERALPGGIDALMLMVAGFCLAGAVKGGRGGGGTTPGGDDKP